MASLIHMHLKQTRVEAFTWIKVNFAILERIASPFTFCPTHLFLIHKVGTRLRDS